MRISKYIADLKIHVRNLNEGFSYYTLISNNLDDVLLNVQITGNFMENRENALTLAKIHLM